MFDLLIYALLILGAGSYGYAVVRLALPDARSWPMNYKMGASVVIGGGIALLSIFIGLISQYFLYFSVLGISLVFVQVVKMKSALFVPSEIEVAVPKKYLTMRVAKEEKMPINVLYKKLKERKPVVAARIVRAKVPRKGLAVPKVKLPFTHEPALNVEAPAVPSLPLVTKRRAITVSKKNLPAEKTLKEAVATKPAVPTTKIAKKKGLFGFMKKSKIKKEKPKPGSAQPTEKKKHLSWRERREERMRAVPTPIAPSVTPPVPEKRRGRRTRPRRRPGREPVLPAKTEVLPALGEETEMPKLGMPNISALGDEDTEMPKLSGLDNTPSLDDELSITDLDSGIKSDELPSIDDMAKLDVIGADAGLQKVKTDTVKRCKFCGAPLKKAIFCSSCGTQFCPNCALSVKVGEHTTEYVCPKCKSKVIVQNT